MSQGQQARIAPDDTGTATEVRFLGLAPEEAKKESTVETSDWKPLSEQRGLLARVRYQDLDGEVLVRVPRRFFSVEDWRAAAFRGEVEPWHKLSADEIKRIRRAVAQSLGTPPEDLVLCEDPHWGKVPGRGWRETGHLVYVFKRQESTVTTRQSHRIRFTRGDERQRSEGDWDIEVDGSLVGYTNKQDMTYTPWSAYAFTNVATRERPEGLTPGACFDPRVRVEMVATRREAAEKLVHQLEQLGALS